MSVRNSIIDNPSTDVPTDFGYISHKTNSLYYAYKSTPCLVFQLDI